jgi:uncharacterized protein with HEPN domain
MTADVAIRLRHMLDSAREAVEFAAGRTRDELARDRILTLALVRCVEIIGEAATKVSAETRAHSSDVPWADIIGMRHRLVHAYFEVDIGRLLDTVRDDLPELIASLERVLRTAI